MTSTSNQYLCRKSSPTTYNVVDRELDLLELIPTTATRNFKRLAAFDSAWGIISERNEKEKENPVATVDPHLPPCIAHSSF